MVFYPEELLTLGKQFDFICRNLTAPSSRDTIAYDLIGRAIRRKMVERPGTAPGSLSLQDSGAAFCSPRN